MSSLASRAAVVAVLLAAAACAERPSPVEPHPPNDPTVQGAPGAAAGSISAQQARNQRLARRLALALGDAEFRAATFRALQSSRVREGKVHLQRFLAQDQGAARRRFAQLAGEPDGAVASDLEQAPQIEIYLPVPDHRRAWQGDARVLVATAERDHDVPVAFEPGGRRVLLDPDRPPATPVIALGRAETGFPEVAGPGQVEVYDEDPNGGQTGGVYPSTTTSPGLYMTYASYTEDFEGWMKGDPEFEVHILGQDGTSNAMKSYQCAGAEAGGPYTFDQNDETWSGSVLLFSQTQLDEFKAQHPDQALRVFVVEDDDSACQIKTDSARVAKLFKDLQTAYNAWTAGRDSTIFGVKNWKKATSFFSLLKSFWSWITTQDDVVGNAIEDAVVGQTWPGANWIVKGENNVTNGGIRLEMR
ncbi:MAG TPA: hypothetical protein VGQ17_13050 [Gemmatimonadales bacterium]|jgi:hypothetical protein|nr:hypothetical protein [Gemmatimonadales bacterium]